MLSQRFQCDGHGFGGSLLEDLGLNEPLLRPGRTIEQTAPVFNCDRSELCRPDFFGNDLHRHTFQPVYAAFSRLRVDLESSAMPVNKKVMQVI